MERVTESVNLSPPLLVTTFSHWCNVTAIVQTIYGGVFDNEIAAVEAAIKTRHKTKLGKVEAVVGFAFTVGTEETDAMTSKQVCLNPAWENAMSVTSTSPEIFTVFVVVVVVVIVVSTLTGIVKSVVTEQAPVTLEWKNTPGTNPTHQKWYVHVCIIAEPSHAPTKTIKIESEVSVPTYLFPQVDQGGR